MKRFKHFKVNAAFFAMITMALMTLAYGKTIYVDDDATGTNDGSSWENAYIYLQDALEDVNSAEKPVKWEISEGGNGHIYQVVAMPEGVSWSDAKEAAEAAGGYLATITSGEENEFVFKLIDDDVYWHHFASGNNHGPWIGGFQQDGAVEPDGGWSWITGEAFSYSNWLSGEPTGYWGAKNENRLQYSSMTGTRESTWNDLIDVLSDFYAVYAYVIEYEEYISEPVEIRVAQGIYKPDEGANQIRGDKDAAFRLVNNIVLKGGFAGFGEPDPNARDVDLYQTILSGDLIGNDIEIDNPEMLLHEHTRTENSCHVLSLPSNIIAATIDGFTITGGDTITGPCRGRYGPFGEGGGLYARLDNADSSITVHNCTFSNNSAALGGGVNFWGGSPRLTNCTFSNNLAAAGGGLYSRESNPTLTNCTFSGNSTWNGAGGMFYYESNPILTNCILWGNVPNEIPEYVIDSTATITYSNIQGGFPGEGNIDVDPLFADPNNGDYHLKSEAGRWNPNTQIWVTDDVTSPCIDAGDPNMPVHDELFPSGIRINMGAYGGTAEASKSISNIPEVVNVNDSDNGSQVTLRQGQILAVTLESNPSTGYSWDRIEKEDSIFEKFGDTLYFPSEQDDGIVGAGGWEILYFRSINIGQETLELVYRRSWETDVEPIKTFSIDVVVN